MLLHLGPFITFRPSTDVVSSLLFSPSIYKSCFAICLQLPPPRLVYKLFAGGKVI